VEYLWINFQERKIDLRKYFEMTMKGVYYRQQNFIIGLRLQLSLVQDQMVKESLKKVLSVPIAFINKLITQYELNKIKNSSQEIEESKLKELSEKIVKSYIPDFDKKNLDFFNFPFNKDELITRIEKEIMKWFKNSNQSSNDLLKSIEKIIPKYFETPKFIRDPSAKIKDYSTSDLEGVWKFVFGEDDEFLQLQTYQISKWNFPKSHEFYKEYRNSTRYSDFARLQLLEISSYNNTLLDIVTSFENFLAYYFGIIVSMDPTKFMNTEGINKNCIKFMKELINEYNILIHSKYTDSDYKEFINRLIKQE